MSDNDISFEEYLELCEEAGISVEDQDTLKADYRVGRALADLTDALILDQEAHPTPGSKEEAEEKMDILLSVLEEGTDSLKGAKEVMIKLGVSVVRYIAEHLYDDGSN